MDTHFLCNVSGKEKRFEVYTAIANTGGITEEDLKIIEEKAYRLGAKGHVSIAVTEKYYNQAFDIWYLEMY
jgi:argininosuccinate synthase